MKREPIHLHDGTGEVLCDLTAHNVGVLTLSTHMAVMVTCPKCLGALDASAFSPITPDELEGLLRRARTSLREHIEPIEHYLARREAEYREWVLFGELLRSLRDSLPWWALVRRHRAKACITRHENEYA